ncbi:hypothetical protein PCASD_13204 [Puccinia coronata f. sp. avenae]|uniref:Uncharacterized protein n=1 Tax=Puccinia coronata f. sp. avenae TaxID=200324 RepID=A0A2N5U2C5_9BASI|nr:hypothetical protein PCASD_13174 [Puccinia coronata f. sp. avenae]PLW31885.1 hypothetical protein PCASD_13204 [Puccinia coronata f. sp. avenae]
MYDVSKPPNGRGLTDPPGAIKDNTGGADPVESPPEPPKAFLATLQMYVRGIPSATIATSYPPGAVGKLGSVQSAFLNLRGLTAARRRRERE